MATYDMLCEARQKCREDNDCAVWALAVTTGVSYAYARDVLDAFGRKPRRGTYHQVMTQAYAYLGFYLREIDRDQIEARTFHGLETELAESYSGRPVLIWATRHYAGWDGRQIVDWTVAASPPSRKRVRALYEVKRKQLHG